VLSAEGLRQLVGADLCNSATSIGWLQRRVEILEHALRQRGLQIATTSPPCRMTAQSEFVEWCRCFLPAWSGRYTVAAPTEQTENWVRSHLIENGRFVFDSGAASSRLGARTMLYSVNVAAGAGQLRASPFALEELLTGLRALGESPEATWLWCSEPHGATAHIGRVWCFDDSYAYTESFQSIEHVDAQQAQCSNAYLLLLPASRRWLLVCHQRFASFSMELHGEAGFLAAVRARLRLD
jgi:hypothetical protein